MTYAETLDWLFAQLPMYQRVGGANYKIDLEKTHALMEVLHHAENGFKSIHVAGTNGKGSVSHLMASALQEEGLKVGLYTSPHLKDFRERIKINGKEISEDSVVGFVTRYKDVFKKLELSFFEMTVGMAFDYFRNEPVDIAIVEVGMGGRLDSTNVITPLVSVITNIGLDHTQFLGDSLAKIAAEKAGIIKPEVPVIIGKTQVETETVFRTTADQLKSPLSFADQLPSLNLSSDLKGDYQEENKATAFYALKNLPVNLKPSEDEIAIGFNNVVKNTGLLGRWQTLSSQPQVICDTGHNEDGIKFVLAQLQKQSFNKLHIVWGMVNDKNVSSILEMLPKEATYYFARPNLPRGLDAEILADGAAKLNLRNQTFTSVGEALKAAKLGAEKNDLIFVGGSTFVVAEVV